MKDANDPTDMAARLLVALSARTDIPDDVRRWMADGLAQHLYRGKTLDAALGLARSGHRSTALEIRRRHRDNEVREAVAAIVVGDTPSSLWKRCQFLEQALPRFLDTFRRTQPREEIPRDWPDWKKALWRAAKIDSNLPTTARALYNIARIR